MAKLTTDKIINELNHYFASGYQYVFWYDPKHEFTDIIPTIETKLDASVYYAQENTQFKTKTDILNNPDASYLVYAPYKRPAIQVNYLTDMELYSKLFTADAAQVILEELQLDNDKLQFVKRYADFFKAKARRAQFIKYWSNEFDNDPEKGIIAAITKVDKLEINELLMKLIAEYLAGDNTYIFELTKYGVLDSFWALMKQQFHYESNDPSIIELTRSLFVTYLSNQLQGKLSKKLAPYILDSVDNTQIFIDRFADSNRYLEDYNEISDIIWDDFDFETILSGESLEDLVHVTIFKETNDLILSKLTSHFSGAEIIDYEHVLAIIDTMLDRRRNNYSSDKVPEYEFLCYTAELFNLKVTTADDWQEALQAYLDKDYQLETIYRKALLAYSKISNDNYHGIKDTVDKYYSNRLLTESVKQWNDTFALKDVPSNLRQSNFYHNYVEPINERVVVIFSDALRYEVGKELEDVLNANDRLTTKMHHALTGLPSVTYTGMNVMLPHQELTWDNKANKVRIDGLNAEGVDNREKILQRYNTNNGSKQVKSILEMSSKQIKEFINGKNVIYLYHNQIDDKGHNTRTTRELVEAAEKAIDEIKQTIQVLRTNGVSHFIVTADHGFIYQERKINDTDKINLSDQTYEGQAHLRYLITPSQLDIMGVNHTTMGEALGNSDPTNIYYPSSANVFVAKSGSKNYVHGGSSLQEMLIPILDIKATSNRSRAKAAEIKLAATTYRINNLKMNLLFNQVAPVSDLVLPAEYRVYFVDKLSMPISNTINIEANRTGSAADRTIPITLTIQNKQYDYNQNYYLIVENTKTNQQVKYTYSMNLLM